MKTFKNKVAVITGAASGIGYGIAKRCVQEGMKVVLADIEKDSLNRTEKEMKDAGATVLSVLTDVSKAGDIENLAQKTLDEFGAVHLLCNNAGVETMKTICEGTLADWEWVLGVNLWGVIHGIRIFLPIMLAQNTEAHIVNTASVAGLVCNPYLGIYKVSKHGVIGLSETLYYELAEKGAKVKVSVLCPAWVNTRIMDSERNRPAELKNDLIQEDTPDISELKKSFRESVENGMSPEQIAEQVFQAVMDEKLYIITHPESKKYIQQRIENILGKC